MQPLISVIIPCYNGAPFIEETLSSILMQSEKNIEVIIVNDGSTDNSEVLIKKFDDKRIQYYYQANQGVSVARNTGLTKVKGRYLMFFDADDVMTENFLKSRFQFLEREQSVDFISGEVERFSAQGKIKEYYRGASSDLVREVLLNQEEVDTCPSNYFFRTEFIKEHGILFNTKLSSTADRFFLLECAQYGKAKFVKELAPLRYRITPSSMSGKLTLNLIKDNEVYYNKLKRTGLVPKEIRNKTLFLSSFILFASYWKIGLKLKALRFAMISFCFNPVAFIKRCAT